MELSPTACAYLPGLTAQLPIWSAITEALPVKVITYDYSLPTPGCLHGSAGPFYSQLITSCVTIAFVVMLAKTSLQQDTLRCDIQ